MSELDAGIMDAIARQRRAAAAFAAPRPQMPAPNQDTLATLRTYMENVEERVHSLEKWRERVQTTPIQDMTTETFPKQTPTQYAALPAGFVAVAESRLRELERIAVSADLARAAVYPSGVDPNMVDWRVMSDFLRGKIEEQRARIAALEAEAAGAEELTREVAGIAASIGSRLIDHPHQSIDWLMSQSERAFVVHDGDWMKAAIAKARERLAALDKETRDADAE